MAGRGAYRSRKKKSLSRGYLLLVLVLTFVMFKWGFSFLIEVIGKTGGTGVQTSQVEDLVPPQTPVISALPEATNSAVLKVQGYTEANVDVEYFINNRRIITERTDDIGFYETSLSLEEGSNLIKVVAKDEAGNESTSKSINVIYDFKNPEITVSSPTEGQEFFGQQKQTISVSGDVSETDVDLRINNTYIRLDSNGLFNQQLRLNEGDNEIKFLVTDKAGNVTEKIVKVKYVR
jgi:hypothetical protein